MGRWRRFLILHYYNDNDQKSCAWLRELIRAGQIPDGVVDERSILDVQPADVAGFVQCHFFAGIGGWSLALKLAGWREDKQIWSGSAPCQPYSAAGRGKGDADERNLWPAFFRLIKAGKPEFVIGEQVSAAIGHGWLDGVFTDLEGEGYTCGAAVLGAHSVGAPHIRQRLYWVANSASLRCDERRTGSGPSVQGQCSERTETQQKPQHYRQLQGRPEGLCGDGGLANADGGESSDGELQRSGRQLQQPQDEAALRMEHAAGDGREQRRAASGERGAERGCGAGGLGDSDSAGSQGRIISGNGSGERTLGPSGLGFWDDYEFIPCADGKQRRIESGSKPLVASVSRGVVPGGDPGVEDAQNSGEARVMRLRGYGNAINTVTASEFIKAVMECC